MKHLPSLLILVGTLGFSACEMVPVEEPGPEPPPEPEPPVYDCSIQVNDTNMVVDMYEREDSVVFLLEYGDSIVHPDSCFISMEVDSAQWSLSLTYRDSTVADLPFFGTFELDEEQVRIDPFEHAPLTALVEFSIPYARRAKVSIAGIGENSPDLEHRFDEPVTSHAIPVYGLYSEHENQVTISLLDRTGRERFSRQFPVTTGPTGTIICGQMTVEVDQYADTARPRFYLVHNAIYDNEGHIRWYTTYRAHKYYLLSDNRVGIQMYNDKGAPAPTVEDIWVINLLGEMEAMYDVPNRNHHEIIEKTPGGNLLVATNSEPYFTTADDTEDAIVEIDRQTGEVVRFWDLRDIFDPSRPRLWTEMPNDWCHLNSIQYDSTDHTLLISSKLQYFISKIDYETGAIRWIFGNHENWKEPWQPFLLNPVNFDAENPDADWTYAQHMPRLTREGHVIVYDNGKSRPGDDFTRILEFRVDSANMTVEKVWTHDFDFQTRTMGSVEVLPEGHVQVGHGEKGLITEINREGEVVFSARLLQFYRSYPIQLYP